MKKNNNKNEEATPNLHRDVMRGVRVMNRRRLILALSFALLIAAIIFGWYVTDQYSENDLSSFLPIMFDSLTRNFSAWGDFLTDINEFIPWQGAILLLASAALLGVIISIIIHFRKALLAKVEDFSGKKNINNNNQKRI